MFLHVLLAAGFVLTAQYVTVLVLLLIVESMIEVCYICMRYDVKCPGKESMMLSVPVEKYRQFCYVVNTLDSSSRCRSLIDDQTDVTAGHGMGRKY